MQKYVNTFTVSNPDYRNVWKKQISVIAILFIACVLAEAFIWKTCYFAIPGFFISSWISYRCFLREEKKTEEEIISKLRSIVNEERVSSDILQLYNNNDIHVVKDKFSYDVIDHYGRMGDRYYLILLSNDRVLEYDISLVEYSENATTLKLVSSPIICNNKHRLRKIEERKRNDFNDYVSRNTNAIRILALVIVVSLFTVLIFICISRPKSLLLIVPLSLVLVFLSVFVLRNKLGKSLAKSIPAILKIALAILIIAITYFSLIAISYSFPFLIMKYLTDSNIINLSIPTDLFFALSFGSIFAVYAPDKIRHRVIISGPLHDFHDHAYKMYMNQLAKKILDRSCLNMSIYLLYFIIMAIVTVHYLQCHTPIFSQDIEYSIIHSFIVYIAFSGFVKFKNNAKSNLVEIMGLSNKVLTVNDDDKEFQDRNYREPLY